MPQPKISKEAELYNSQILISYRPGPGSAYSGRASVCSMLKNRINPSKYTISLKICVLLYHFCGIDLHLDLLPPPTNSRFSDNDIYHKGEIQSLPTPP